MHVLSNQPSNKPVMLSAVLKYIHTNKQNLNTHRDLWEVLRYARVHSTTHGIPGGKESGERKRSTVHLENAETS